MDAVSPKSDDTGCVCLCAGVTAGRVPGAGYRVPCAGWVVDGVNMQFQEIESVSRTSVCD